MPFNPGVSWFVPFHEHDPSKSSKCIYFTQKEARCQWPCSDNERAIQLYETISSLPAETVGVELLEEYILCNCCISGRAQHRHRIEDVELLIPLAERWQDEIRRHAAEQSSLAASVVPLGENVILADAVTIPATPNFSRANSVYNTGTASRTDDQPNTPASSSISATPPTSVTSLSPYQTASLTSSNTSPEISPLRSGGGSRYGLRSHETNNPTNAISARPKTIFRPPLSEFRTHIEEPDPSDSVSHKILDKLEGRDFETGSLYIFERASSPGYVKIGWTAVSVSRRLDSWSECGYTPNLLFKVHDIPHAQRVETLTHYELIKEWRRERRCKAEWCGKSHQEWFAVSKERAGQVLGDWAELMKVAELYDSEGFLNATWKDFVLAMKSGETLTAKKLLEQYQLSLAKQTTLVGEWVNPGRTPKLEKQEEVLWSTPRLEDLERPKVPLLRPDSLRVESKSTKETLLLESKGLSEPTLLTNTPPAGLGLLEPTNQPTVDRLSNVEPLTQSQFTFTAGPSFKFEPSPKTEAFFKPERFAQAQFSFAPHSPFNIEPSPETATVPRISFPFGAETPFKIEPLWKIPPPLGVKSLSKAEPFLGIESRHENVPAKRTPEDKELSPEQIPLPPSPLLRPANSQDAETYLSQEIKKLCVTDIITESDNGSAVPPSSEPDAFNSSATSSSPTPKAEPKSSSVNHGDPSWPGRSDNRRFNHAESA